MKCNVAASTQNQAFNSLLFLFRHALKRDFGELREVPRAKKSLYVPVVLSREEIDSILAHLFHPYSLIVKLLFGCGLRLFECLQLRVRDFNFEAGNLTKSIQIQARLSLIPFSAVSKPHQSKRKKPILSGMGFF